jgi:hypothetical protein
MNLLEARVALRPRTMSDVLDLAGPFCLANRRVFAPLAIWLTAVGGLLAFVCRRQAGFSWASVWLVVAGYLWLAGGLYTVAAGELLFREPADLRLTALLGRFARRLVELVVARVVHAVALLFCASLLVPLPIFAARWMFVVEAVLLESAMPFPAFTRSSRLALHRGVPCLGLALSCFLAPLLFALAAELLGFAVVELTLQMGRPFGALFSDGGSAYAVIGALLSAPFVASASFLGYIDLRTRKEGWDIQLRFMALADGEGQPRRGAA